MLSIKICGMADRSNIGETMSLRPDYLGLIFHTASPRNACDVRPEAVRVLKAAMKFVGVFVNRPQDEIIERAETFGLTAIQLHGSESPEFCRQMRGRGFEVWKAVGIEDEKDIEMLTGYVGCVDRFVFDKKSKSHGGTGKKFDWNLLSAYDLPVGFMLGGGIGPDDIDAISDISIHPRLIGLDLNSRFELLPGVKDIRLLYDFLTQLRNYEQNRQAFR